MKIDFRPRDDGKVSLFANWGEAVVFWLSLAGLILLGLITVVRSIDRAKTRNTFQEFRSEQQQVLQKIELLEQQKKMFKEQSDSLRTQYRDLKSRSKVGPEKKELISKPQTDREINRLKFLKASKRKY